MRNILDLLIDDFHEQPLPELMPRQQSMAQVAGKANCVVGMRRAGKTWFCYQQMRQLLAQGIPKERLLYLNFEDERLLPFSAANFHLILEAYFRKFPAFKHQQCCLFLDEVQRIAGWEHVCPACAGHRAIVGVCHGLVLQAAEYRHRHQFARPLADHRDLSVQLPRILTFPPG
jgi:hypothetical protein